MKKTVYLIVLFVLSIKIYGQEKPAYKNLMPIPQKIVVQKGKFILNKSFSIAIPDDNIRIKIASTKFIRRLSDRTGIFLKTGFPFISKDTLNYKLIVKYKRLGKLELNEDESYKIKINKNKITLSAPTDLGIIHAFETLLQLLDYNEKNYFFQNIRISDSPRFTWRGLLIDVARHFEPVSVIKRNLDAMLVAKMNIFHWHLSDNQGFRIEVKKYPKLTKLATDGQYYTQEQIKDVVKYASDRGIIVMPEIDVPGHATALLTAFPEIGSVQDTTYTLQRNAGIFKPTLDPTNPRTYEVLYDIFKELSNLFPFEYVHIGGDENKGEEWNHNKYIQAFKKNKKLKTNHELQTYFNLKLVKILKKFDKKIMGWEEISDSKLPKNAIIHSWMGKPGQSLSKAVKKGYHAVLSNGFYIDLMLPASSHYKTRFITDNYPITDNESKLILGGEATMWGELVTPLTIDSRIWPRTLAIGERLWSNADVRNKKDMYRRLFIQSYHLEELGITHIRNKDVILRNITENQNIKSLKKLTKIYEPLKYYTRNKGGTEYQTYSPFTLFADACSSDAKDAIIFKELVEKYIKNPNKNTQTKITDYLKKWKDIDKNIKKLKPNPKLKSLYPMTESLSKLMKDLIDLTQNNKDKKSLQNKIDTELEIASKNYQDVSLAISQDLKKLILFWNKAE